MQKLILSVTAVCAAALVSGVIGYLIPKGGYEKPVKIVLGLFLLCVIVTAFGTEFDFSDISPDYSYSEQTENLTSTVTQHLVEQSVSRIKHEVQQVMMQMDIADAEIDVIMNISDNASISVSQVDIGVPPKHFGSKQRIKKLIDSRLGLYADVYVMEVENE